MSHNNSCGKRHQWLEAACESVLSWNKITILLSQKSLCCRQYHFLLHTLHCHVERLKKQTTSSLNFHLSFILGTGSGYIDAGDITLIIFNAVMKKSCLLVGAQFSHWKYVLLAGELNLLYPTYSWCFLPQKTPVEPSQHVTQLLYVKMLFI